jgi:rare lipoprotein A
MTTSILRAAAVTAIITLGTAAAGAEEARPPPKVETAPDGETTVVQEGKASFYGDRFHGRPTASGERFDQNRPTAASRDLPLGTTATVTNPENGRETEVRVNDRGPYVGGRVIDLSRKAAEDLEIVGDGVADVRIEQKPSAQPDAEAREKVEEKAEDLAEPGQRSRGDRRP